MTDRGPSPLRAWRPFDHAQDMLGGRNSEVPVWVIRFQIQKIRGDFSMAYFRDLHEWLDFLDSRGFLRRISRPINKDTEMHPLVRFQFCGPWQSIQCVSQKA